jgi:PAS domain S-box-containing protein
VNGPGKRILIVEDQRLIAADLENTLQRIGYQVAGSVASGEEAVARAIDVCPDLVLMDIRLRGEMDGIQAAEAIRARTDIPIVYLTAYADEETILRAKVTSPFGYVVKPFNERELRAAIEVAIYKHETDRLLADERARRRAAEEFKLMVEGVEDYAIFLIDLAGRVATWNEGARRIKGYTADEILGKHFSVFYTPEDAAAGAPEATLEAARREGRSAGEGWRVRKGGSRFWASAVLSPVRGDHGELHGFGKITRDLSERKRAEEQREDLIAELRAAVRARDEFLQIASHELKTPLTPLQLQLEALARVLEKSAVSDERLAGKMDTAIRQVVRLSRLVESLLDVSRVTAGRIALEIEPLDLAGLVRDVARRFDGEARRAGSELSVLGDESIPGRWDRLRIEQIVSNLLSNAIKYGGGNPVEIATRASDGAVRISVTDQGIGIAKEALGRIFERFERAVSVRHFGGLGLGLFIARQYAEAHGGSIVAKSRPGAGSTFTVVLPLEPTAHSAVSPARGGEEHTT